MKRTAQDPPPGEGLSQKQRGPDAALAPAPSPPAQPQQPTPTGAPPPLKTTSSIAPRKAACKRSKGRGKAGKGAKTPSKAADDAATKGPPRWNTADPGFTVIQVPTEAFSTDECRAQYNVEHPGAEEVWKGVLPDACLAASFAASDLAHPGSGVVPASYHVEDIRSSSCKRSVDIKSTQVGSARLTPERHSQSAAC